MGWGTAPGDPRISAGWRGSRAVREHAPRQSNAAVQRRGRKIGAAASRSRSPSPAQGNFHDSHQIKAPFYLHSAASSNGGLGIRILRHRRTAWSRPSPPATQAYVTQENVFLGTLTVRENVAFSAQVRLPGSTEVKAVVDGALEEMGLADCADRPIGGEKKRLAIALEVLFLDEPTNGLDSA